MNQQQQPVRDINVRASEWWGKQKAKWASFKQKHPVLATIAKYCMIIAAPAILVLTLIYGVVVIGFLAIALIGFSVYQRYRLNQKPK